MFRLKAPLFLLFSAIALLAMGVAAAPVYAHGFGERYDLPLPLTYFVVAGAAAVALSFLVVALFVGGDHSGERYPRLNLFALEPLRLVLSGPVTWLLKTASLLLFLLVIATGLYGSERPVNNLTPTFVWIIWWVGMGFVVSLLGNLWAVVNPWKIVFGLFEFLYHRITPEWELTLGLDYAQRVGVWPSVFLFFAFVWVENALPDSASPELLSWLIIAYSVLTLGGMLLFGKHQWLRYGEVFTVIYGFLTRFSITEVRTSDPMVCHECSDPQCSAGTLNYMAGCVDCYECFEYARQQQLNLRPPAIGLHSQGPLPVGLTAMVLLMLSTVTFDGFSDTPEWASALGWALTQTPQLTSPYFNGLVIANTLGLGLFPLAFAAVYWVCCAMMQPTAPRRSGPDHSPAQLMTAFVFSLVPIALAYHFAHYLGFLLIQGQLIIPLASDPFGNGANFFGTASYVVDITVTNARFIWFFAVTSIVVGHIIAVYLAHLKAVNIFVDRNLALKSQVPMLVLMVLYTVVSLWIISRPITE